MSLKFYPRLQVYKNYNGNNEFNPKKIQAFSYKWWKFVDFIGYKVVFNCYTYSNTTSKHQWDMRSLLKELGIKIDLFIESPRGLQDLNSAIEYYNSEISQLETEIDNPKSNNEKNIERLRLIEEYLEKINEVEKLKVA